MLDEWNYIQIILLLQKCGTLIHHLKELLFVKGKISPILPSIGPLVVLQLTDCPAFSFSWTLMAMKWSANFMCEGNIFFFTPAQNLPLTSHGFWVCLCFLNCWQVDFSCSFSVLLHVSSWHSWRSFCALSIYVFISLALSNDVLIELCWCCCTTSVI